MERWRRTVRHDEEATRFASRVMTCACAVVVLVAVAVLAASLLAVVQWRAEEGPAAAAGAMHLRHLAQDSAARARRALHAATCPGRAAVLRPEAHLGAVPLRPVRADAAAAWTPFFVADSPPWKWERPPAPDTAGRWSSWNAESWNADSWCPPRPPSASVGKRWAAAVAQRIELPPGNRSRVVAVHLTADARPARWDRLHVEVEFDGPPPERPVLAVARSRPDSVSAETDAAWLRVEALGLAPQGTHSILVRLVVEGLLHVEEEDGREEGRSCFSRVAADAYGFRPPDSAKPRPLRHNPLAVVVAQDKVALTWATHAPLDAGALAVRGPGAASKGAATPTVTTLVDWCHFAHVAPLPAGASSFRLEDASPGVFGDTPALPGSGSARSVLVVVADHRADADALRDALGVATAHAPRLLLHVGDAVVDGSSDAQWALSVRAPLDEWALAARVPFLTVAGARDGNSTLRAAYLGGGGPPWPSSYAMDVGSARVVVLDARTGRDATLAFFVLETSNDEFKYAMFRVVVIHTAPFCTHADAAHPNFDGDAWAREHLVPLFQRAAVDVVVGGGCLLYSSGVHEKVRYINAGTPSHAACDNLVAKSAWFFPPPRPLPTVLVVTVDGCFFRYQARSLADEILDLGHIVGARCGERDKANGRTSDRN